MKTECGPIAARGVSAINGVAWAFRRRLVIFIAVLFTLALSTLGLWPVAATSSAGERVFVIDFSEPRSIRQFASDIGLVEVTRSQDPGTYRTFDNRCKTTFQSIYPKNRFASPEERETWTVEQVQKGRVGVSGFWQVPWWEGGKGWAPCYWPLPLVLLFAERLCTELAGFETLGIDGTVVRCRGTAGKLPQGPKPPDA